MCPHPVNPTYRISHDGSTLGPPFAHIDLMASSLYDLFLHNSSVSYSDVRVYQYSDVSYPPSAFKVRYDNGLIVYQDDTTIRLQVLFPYLASLDVQLRSRQVTARTSIEHPNQRKQPLQARVEQQRLTRDSMLARAPVQTRPPSKASISSVDFSPIPIAAELVRPPNSRVPLPKPQEPCANIEPCTETPVSNPEHESECEEINWTIHKAGSAAATKKTINDKLKVYTSDRHSYFQIKKDIDEDNFDEVHIHPAFAIKYSIFKVLVARGEIVQDEPNIEHEYSIFADLYEDCMDDSSEDEGPTPVSNVYVPHNYFYLSSQEKEELAARYSMTPKQFEDSHVNRAVDDDEIETHMRSLTKPMVMPTDSIPARNQAKTDAESESETDSDGNSTCSDTDSDSDSSTDTDYDLTDAELALTHGYKK